MKGSALLLLLAIICFTQVHSTFITSSKWKFMSSKASQLEWSLRYRCSFAKEICHSLNIAHSLFQRFWDGSKPSMSLEAKIKQKMFQVTSIMEKDEECVDIKKVSL